jgi:hypothetical protein
MNINATKSLLKELKSIKTYVYDKPTINLDLIITAQVESDTLPVDSEFKIVSPQIDSSVDEEFLVGRYVKFNDMYRRVIGYDTLTKTIKIESDFGVAITTADTLEIIIKDSMYINYSTDYVLKSQISRGIQYKMIVFLYVKCSSDFDKSNISKIVNDTQDLIIGINRYNVDIYDFDTTSPTYNTIVGNMIADYNMPVEDISVDGSKDVSNGYSEFRMTLKFKYKIKY